MKLFKMTFVDSKDFERAYSACAMAFGFLAVKKKTLIWFICFEPGDYEVVRETLESVGSIYRGVWHM